MVQRGGKYFTAKTETVLEPISSSSSSSSSSSLLTNSLHLQSILLQLTCLLDNTQKITRRHLGPGVLLIHLPLQEARWGFSVLFPYKPCPHPPQLTVLWQVWTVLPLGHSLDSESHMAPSALARVPWVCREHICRGGRQERSRIERREEKI